MAHGAGDGGLATNSCQTLATPWTAACQASLSMGFSRQEYWSGLPFPSPGDLPDPGIEPRCPALQAGLLSTELPGSPVRRHKRCGFDPWVGKIPWSRKQQPTTILLPGESHGQRSLLNYSPWGLKESDTTEGAQGKSFLEVS